jgi:hypothetical protein
VDLVLNMNTKIGQWTPVNLGPNLDLSLRTSSVWAASISARAPGEFSHLGQGSRPNVRNVPARSEPHADSGRQPRVSCHCEAFLSLQAVKARVEISAQMCGHEVQEDFDLRYHVRGPGIERA